MSPSLYDYWTVRLSSTRLLAEKTGRGWRPQVIHTMTQPTSKQQVLLDLSQWFEAHLDEKTSVTILLEPSLRTYP